MSLACMPFLVVNMGGEMIFILDQRLKAQCVAPDKVRATVSDVVLHRLGKVEQGIARHYYVCHDSSTCVLRRSPQNGKGEDGVGGWARNLSPVP